MNDWDRRLRLQSAKELQLDLPFDLDDWAGIHDVESGMRVVYLDQAPHHTQSRDYSFFACFTPEGIKDIDAHFVAEIRKLKRSKKQYQKLRKQIQMNVHLHQIIKDNLIANLERVWSSFSKGVENVS